MYGGLYIALLIVHVFVSIVLISVILLQAGRGGGLSEAFSGISSTKTIFGTSATTFLTRATSACAIVFIITCLSLAGLSLKGSRSIVLSAPQAGSIMDKMPAQAAGQTAADQPATETAAPAGETGAGTPPAAKDAAQGKGAETTQTAPAE